MGESPVRTPWVPRLIVAVGVVAALIMGWLGLWQAQVFADQGKSAAAAITGEPVRALDASVTGDNVGFLWGHTVSVSGHYLPGQQERRHHASRTVRPHDEHLLADGRVV